MDRVARFNVLAMSGRAVEASGDVDVILLDKTGTITYGNRLAASITAGARASTEADALDARALVVVDPRRDARGSLDRRRSPGSASPSSAPPAGTGRRRRLRGARRDDRRGDPVPGRDPDERRPDRRPAT